MDVLPQPSYFTRQHWASWEDVKFSQVKTWGLPYRGHSKFGLLQLKACASLTKTVCVQMPGWLIGQHTKWTKGNHGQENGASLQALGYVPRSLSATAPPRQQASLRAPRRTGERVLSGRGKHPLQIINQTEKPGNHAFKVRKIKWKQKEYLPLFVSVLLKDQIRTWLNTHCA